MAIERDKILDAALTLLNEVGLDQLTTRRLAERLGVQQPALYWHFKSKSALLDGLNELMLARYHKHRVPDPGETWDQFAAANARSFRDAMVAVRDGARINASTRPQATQFADAERQLRLYVGAGFSGEEAFNISIALARYVVGFVLEEQDELERSEEDGRGSDADPLSEVAAFPILSEVLKPLLDGGTINTEGVFEGGLAYLIDGARQSLARKRK
jgi:TetR/AcrR family tetracycline transcriptional repressor